jgi:hypothetical protein
VDAGGFGFVTAWQEARRLERQQRRHAAFENNADAYLYRVRPSCPPDTRIWVTMPAGALWSPPAGNSIAAGWFPEPAAFDLFGGVNVVNAIYQFVNPHWYIACTAVPWDLWSDSPYVALFGPGTEGGFTGGIETEYETAVEAEVALGAFLTDGMTYMGPPACQLILRNDGNVNLPLQILPIDAVNRGRSYLLQHEVRAKWSL